MTGLSYTLREAFTNISRNGLVVLGAVLAGAGTALAVMFRV